MHVFLYLVPQLLKAVSVQILQMQRVAEELQTIPCDIYEVTSSGNHSDLYSEGGQFES